MYRLLIPLGRAISFMNFKKSSPLSYLDNSKLTKTCWFIEKYIRSVWLVQIHFLKSQSKVNIVSYTCYKEANIIELYWIKWTFNRRCSSLSNLCLASSYDNFGGGGDYSDKTLGDKQAYAIISHTMWYDEVEQTVITCMEIIEYFNINNSFLGYSEWYHTLIIV